MRDFLYALSQKYDGDVYKMYKALMRKEEIKPMKVCEDCIIITDEIYPEVFKELAFPPLVLYYRGDISLIKEECVGIIGSRKPLGMSVSFTKEIVSKLSGVTISGLAYGIDSIVHEETLKDKRPTIGVIGSGFDNMYPSKHQSLMEKCSLVLSEYPARVKALPHHFIQRNRIIASLSSVLIITEAKLKSGTSHTARFALDLGKDIYCVPGHPLEKNYEGCHALINDGAYCLYDLKKQLAKYCK